MNCKMIQQWLMTDYLDNELDAQKSAEVESHVKECLHCREVLETIDKTARAPFKDAQSLHPGPDVWQGIQEKIQAEQERSGWFGRLKDRLIPVLRIPRPVYRVAFALVLIIAVAALVRWPSGRGVDTAYAYIEEQMVFLDELQAGSTGLLDGDLSEYEGIFDETQE